PACSRRTTAATGLACRHTKAATSTQTPPSSRPTRTTRRRRLPMPRDANAIVEDLTPDFVRLQSVMDRAAEVTARHAVKHAQRYLYHTHQKGDATLSKITARFDGRECKFHIARNHIP